MAWRWVAGYVRARQLESMLFLVIFLVTCFERRGVWRSRGTYLVQHPTPLARLPAPRASHPQPPGLWVVTANAGGSIDALAGRALGSSDSRMPLGGDARLGA